MFIVWFYTCMLPATWAALFRAGKLYSRTSMPPYYSAYISFLKVNDISQITEIVGQRWMKHVEISDFIRMVEPKNMSDTLARYLGIKSDPSESEILLFERAQKYLRAVSWIPGLRMIAVCNSLSMYASEPGSDIDIFVVTNPRRMWVTRVCMTAIFQILGVRRHGKKVAWRFCLSFFCTTSVMDFEKIAIENDVYLKAWVNHLKPIVDIGGCYGEFLGANAGWMEVVSVNNKENTRFRCIEKPLSEERLGWWWNFLDALLRAVFEPLTLKEYERLGKPWGIIVSKDMLKFHPGDRRREVRGEIGN